MDTNKTANIFKALADPCRVDILISLQHGEKCICKTLEELDKVQSTLSHHLKILSDAGLVTGRKDGKWTHYSLDEKGCQRAKALLNNVLEIKEENNVCSCVKD